MSEKTCPICGEPTNVYMGKTRKDGLCRKHAMQANKGEIIQCFLCNEWHNADEACKCSTKKNSKKQNFELIDESTMEDLTCIVCGNISNGKHFCYDCYKKFANKILYLKVSKCKDFEKLEAEYESDFVCDDGHLVKSPYEKIIDNWLYQEGIQHAYEKKIDIDKDKDLTPDFYIPEYNGKKNIYVEFWGYDESNKKYQQRKEYKTKIYPDLVKREKITVVYLNRKEIENDSYKKKIKYADIGKINE
ncbi:MAG: hypothetical protein E7364_06760 [Clostridiales bacterium]|nr:hypothetical protein [Clostridiales bacterium]